MVHILTVLITVFRIHLAPFVSTGMSQYSTPIGGNQQPLLQRVDGGTSSTAAKVPFMNHFISNKVSFFQVAEVFLTAGHAFEKLGEITLQLNSLPDTREKYVTNRNLLLLFDLPQIKKCIILE